jgi:prepilin-type N-terminal cleavage/methylation domain-containing protein
MIQMVGTLKNRGFTIVELLIVIVVIGILAAITVVAFNGIQDRARLTKVQSDTALIVKAVTAARTLTGQTMRDITGSGATAAGCVLEPTGVDLAMLDKEASDCWTSYRAALQALQDASGVTVTGLVDPWGQPYYIDENEGENPVMPDMCWPDSVGTHARPHVQNAWGAENEVTVPNSIAGC